MNIQNLTTFYIVRHAESKGNTTRISGMPDEKHGEFGTSLTDLGREQALSAGVNLSNIHFDAAFSSDLLRAKETAEIILAKHQLAVTTTKLLRERRKGDAIGDLEKELTGELSSIFDLLETVTENEKSEIEKKYSVESREETTSRFITFLREIALVYKGKTILVVCHGGIMRALLMHLGYVTNKELVWDSIKNTGYFILQTDGVEFQVTKTHLIDKKIQRYD